MLTPKKFDIGYYRTSGNSEFKVHRECKITGQEGANC